MLIDYKLGQGSIVLRVKLLNSSVGTGAGLTGLTSASSGLIISTIADNEATATAYTVAGSTIETITTLGTYAAPTATKCRFKEVDSTNHKGIYEIQIADARFAVSSAKSLLISVLGATNCAETDVVIPLRQIDPYNAVRMGMTALPNAAADAAGGLPISDAGGLDLDAQIGTKINDILTDTGTTLQAELDGIQAKTDNLPSDPADASDIAASFSSLNTKVDTIDDFLDTEIAAIKAKTDNLPSDPADASDIAASFSSIASTLSTIAAYIDTEVAAIKAKTDNLPSDPADASDIATSFASITTLIDALPTNAELATALASADDATLAAIAALSIPTAIQNADALLGRSVATVEGTAAEWSLCTIILAMLESSVSGTTWTIKRSNGSTTHFTKTITVDAAADPITGVS